MFTFTGLPVILCRSRRRASTSEPDLPMTMPGRAVWMSTSISPRCFVILMSERPAWASLVSMWSRIVEVLEQVVGELALVEPGRLPVVDVADAEALGVDLLSHYVPLGYSSSGRQDDAHVAGLLLDARRAAAGAGAPALQRRALVDADLGDPQVLGDELVVVLGVGGCRVDQLADVAARRRARRTSSSVCASVTAMPRTWSATRRALRGATRT